jgi:hypothetical protein
MSEVPVSGLPVFWGLVEEGLCWHFEAGALADATGRKLGCAVHCERERRKCDGAKPSQSFKVTPHYGMWDLLRHAKA